MVYQIELTQGLPPRELYVNLNQPSHDVLRIRIDAYFCICDAVHMHSIDMPAVSKTVFGNEMQSLPVPVLEVFNLFILNIAVLANREKKIEKDSTVFQSKVKVS